MDVAAWLTAENRWGWEPSFPVRAPDRGRGTGGDRVAGQEPAMPGRRCRPGGSGRLLRNGLTVWIALGRHPTQGSRFRWQGAAVDRKIDT